jgi:hypothetical protein
MSRFIPIDRIKVFCIYCIQIHKVVYELFFINKNWSTKCQVELAEKAQRTPGKRQEKLQRNVDNSSFSNAIAFSPFN